VQLYTRPFLVKTEALTIQAEARPRPRPSELETRPRRTNSGDTEASRPRPHPHHSEDWCSAKKKWGKPRTEAEPK